MSKVIVMERGWVAVVEGTGMVAVSECRPVDRLGEKPLEEM